MVKAMNYDELPKRYLNDTKKNGHPLNALARAISDYLEIRYSWLNEQNKLKRFFRWRGNTDSGQLFFSRTKTERNIFVMNQVLKLAIAPKDISFQRRCDIIKSAKNILSKAGMGRLLLDTFLKTAISKQSAYIGKESTEGISVQNKNDEIYISGKERFIKGKILGAGQYGEVSRLRNLGKGRNIVFKEFHSSEPATTVKKELKLFQEVYDEIGKPYFYLNAEHPECLNCQIIEFPGYNGVIVRMPEIPGCNLFTRLEFNKYDQKIEQMIFYAIFNALWIIHTKLKITHNDAHVCNIQIIDDLYNVFLVDFGLADKFEEINDTFRRSICRDISQILINMIYCRYLANLGMKSITFNGIFEGYGPKNWLNAFQMDETYKDKILNRVNKKLYEYYKGRRINNKNYMSLKK